MIAPFDLLNDPLQPGTTLIEASAGTGKTYAITGILLRLILEQDCRVEEILVTTYTEAATAELRDRVRTRLRAMINALHDEPTADPLVAGLIGRVPREKALERLGRAISSFDQAAIYTIHGFCQRLLRDRAFESAMLFDPELVTDPSSIILEVAEDFWRNQFYSRDSCLSALALSNGITPSSLLELYRPLACHPDLAILPPTTEQDLAAATDEIITCFAMMRAAWKATGPQIRAVFSAQYEPWAKGNTKIGKPANTDRWIDAIAACFDGDGATLAALAAFAELTDEAIAGATKKGKTTPQFELFALCARLNAAIGPWLLRLKAHFLVHARAETARRMRQRNVVCFDDLLFGVHAALKGPGGAALTEWSAARFKAALIDEFQDTDPLQEDIFQRLFTSPSQRLYLIGDPKQAIYGFRGADLFSYLSAATRATQRFGLRENFRSEPRLIKAVNTLFDTSAPFVIDQVDFTPVEPAKRPDAPVLAENGVPAAGLHIWQWPAESQESVWEALPIAAAATAAEIARVLQSPLTIGGKRVQPGDIAVIIANHWQARAVQEKLSALNIPCVLQSGGNVFEMPEAHQLHAILSAIAAPGHDGRLRTAMATEAMGMTAAGLATLSANEDSCHALVERFQACHHTWASRGFIQMFRQFFQMEDMRPRLLALPGGERRLTNFLHLGELLHTISTEQRLAMRGLLQWFSRQLQGATDEDSRELRLERDDAAVRIVTMHKSKGLEYNIVFCPCVWGRPPKARGQSERTPSFHSPQPPHKLTVDLGTDSLQAHCALEDDERLAEQCRLFYVALTRAKHQCHLIWGRFKDCGASGPAWLFHRTRAVSTPPAAAARSHFKDLTEAQFTDDLSALAAQSGGAITVRPLPEPTGPRYSLSTGESRTLAARSFTASIPSDWDIASFTSLSSRRGPDAPEHDHDSAPAPEGLPGPETIREGIHAFPAGRTAGVCWHEIFEELDFCNPGAVRDLVALKLRAFQFDPVKWGPVVSQAVEHTLGVELEPGLRLGSVTRAQRLVELEFHLPVAGMDVAALHAVLPAAVAGQLDFPAWRGMLKGFIDLVFEHNGRFYIIDWKSNLLGPGPDSYQPGALAEEMVSSRYTLQYHLYCVALHRYLHLRLPGYDFERHFGGVFYLFIRGIDPARPERGVFRDRPSRDLIESLDALFGKELPAQ